MKAAIFNYPWSIKILGQVRLSIYMPFGFKGGDLVGTNEGETCFWGLVGSGRISHFGLNFQQFNDYSKKIWFFPLFGRTQDRLICCQLSCILTTCYAGKQIFYSVPSQNLNLIDNLDKIAVNFFHCPSYKCCQLFGKSTTTYDKNPRFCTNMIWFIINLYCFMIIVVIHSLFLFFAILNITRWFNIGGCVIFKIFDSIWTNFHVPIKICKKFSLRNM